MSVTPIPRFVRPVPRPLGLYFHAGFNAHTTLSELLANGQRSYHGVVVDATRVKRHADLLRGAERSRLECILDPCTQASATVGGYTDKHGNLPWGRRRPHVVGDFKGVALKEFTGALADFAVKHRFSEVMAPTHYIENSDSPWVQVDVESSHAIREALDRAGGKNIEVIYPLCVSYSLVRDEDQRESLINRLGQDLPVHSLWLRVDGCGAGSNPTQLRNYFYACRDFAAVGLPLVADQIGGLPGLSLLAFGAVGGIATGVALGERFDASPWHRLRVSSEGFSPLPRVYLPSVDLMLKPVEARQLFDRHIRLKAKFGCSDPDCCGRGLSDMLEKPARHFVVQRINQIADLSQHAESVRPAVFLDRIVRPMTDQALSLSKITGLDEELAGRLSKHRHRLDATRVMLGKLLQPQSIDRPTLRVPQTRVMREGPSLGRI
ncbi:MAG: hypothetical protein ACKVQT_28590 [Burkholderiales bacterium]